MDDRQQRRERRYRQGQEAPGRAGCELRPRQGGGGRRRRSCHSRQLQGIAHAPEKWEPVFRKEHAPTKDSPMSIQTPLPKSHQSWEQVRNRLDQNAPFSNMYDTPYYRDAVYDHFSKAEYARRYATLRDKMR